MISVEEARARILSLMSPVGREVVAITAACGRVLAQDIVARRTQPPFNASAMDGYAARNDEVAPGAVFRVVGEAAAGHGWQGAAAPGQAVRIFTGAPVPDGLDRIIIQEDVTRDGDTITLRDTLDEAAYLRRAGLDFSAGETLLTKGTRITPENVALIASAGHALVTVHRKPRVALLATGDELALPGDPVGDSGIISSNNFGLAAMIESLHASAEILPIALDEADPLRALALEGAQADLFVTLGGASVGDHDLIRPALTGHGLELDLYKVAMRPGKPLMAGRLNGTPMVGLPGNPVSAMVCGRVFLAPAIAVLSGMEGSAPATRRAVLDIDIGKNGPREHYMRARCVMDDGVLRCTPFDSQDSSRLALLSRANALMIRPMDDPPRDAGQEITVILLDV